MENNHCKICRGTVCSKARNKNLYPPGSGINRRTLYRSPQSQEPDPMFTVSYERQQAQDRETIRAMLTGRTLPVVQHARSRGGAAPTGSRASMTHSYQLAAATEGCPTGLMAVPASRGPVPSRLPWSLGRTRKPHPSSARAQPEAPTTHATGVLSNRKVRLLFPPPFSTSLTFYSREQQR
ncbi:uncharacterized protein EI90DRAFT_3088400 [Cantharellus anzutake]|uniref:uncharacterized protein n=1 Tax=Cantharellus anzutake TaxID=1750568 RepID=UPI001905EE71|nr:uncharacterized protein EI90DRAFT_3088400 [Cantharellus anzutake]KAF8315271.1 hypothetical protein EI90DRAFT_3088400 [Cantharellus anzutake]